MSGTCATCRFGDFRPDRDGGICRFAPPSGGGWPAIQSDDWCGGFESNEAQTSHKAGSTKKGEFSLTPERRAVLEYIIENGPISTSSVAAALDRSGAVISRAIWKMQAEGLLVSPSYGVWAAA